MTFWHAGRLPKVLPIFGWICLCVGLLMGLFALTSTRAPLAARTASAAIFMGGMAFVVMYRNFYVAPRAYEVAFRSVLGKEHVLPYSDIAQYRVQTLKGQQFLTVKSSHAATTTMSACCSPRRGWTAASGCIRRMISTVLWSSSR